MSHIHVRLNKHSAVRELGDAFQEFHLWGTLAWFDIKQRYRRALIGPFWLTISSAILITALSFVWSTIFKIDVADYVPFFAVGHVFWTFVAGSLAESCTAFVQFENVIKQTRLPYPTYVLRVVARNFVILVHNAIIVVAIWALLPDRFDVHFGWFVLGLTIVFLFCFFLGLFLATLCTRFRDLTQMVQALLQVVFFVTPILWKPEVLANRGWMLNFNPFAHLIDAVRAPLIGHGDVTIAAAYASLFLLATALVSFALFRRFRLRISYWL